MIDSFLGSGFHRGCMGLQVPDGFQSQPRGSYPTPFLGRLLCKITDPNHKTVESRDLKGFLLAVRNQMGVSENRRPQYGALNRRILIIRTPK